MLRQQYVEFTIALICLVVATALLITCCKKAAKAEDTDTEETWCVFSTIFAFCTLAAFIATMMTIGGAINPAYYAINDIMSMLPTP
jgi:bacteriorhodopsin